MSSGWPLGRLPGAPRRGGLFRALLLQPPAALALQCAALFLVVSLALMLPVIDSSMRLARDQVDARMLRLAMAAAATIDADRHQTIRSAAQIGSEEYRQLLAPLVRFHNAVPGIRNLFTMRVEGERLLYVLDTAWSPGLQRASDPPVTVNEPVDFDLAEDPDFLPTLRSGQAYIDRRDHAIASASRLLRSVEAPIRNGAGEVVALLSLDFEENLYFVRQREIRARAVGAVVAVNVLLALLIGGVIHRLRRRVGEALEGFTRELKTDGLTGLFNRRYFNRCLSREVARAHQESSTLSLMIFDADHFKRVNDTHGHPAGDRVLVCIAACLQECVAEPARAFRIGGEEFAVVLPGQSATAALALYERLRAAIRRPIAVDGAVLEVTVSGGIAELGAGESDERLLTRADQALYVAKQGGRDLAVLAAAE